MVVTCFEELSERKGIVFVRADVIANLDEDEGKTLLTRLVESYLLEGQHEQIHHFNN